MSRTYRRKNAEYDAFFYDFLPYDGTSQLFRRVPLKGKELKKAKAKYHSDSLATMNQVPSWYKRIFCRKAFRSKEKNVLNKYKYTDYEGIVMPLNKDNALYYW